MLTVQRLKEMLKETLEKPQPVKPVLFNYKLAQDR
jgi:hypothetical protein